MTRTDDPLQTTRALLNREASLRHGFLDVLGESVASETPTLAQAAMNSPLVAGVYERLWRPVAFYVASGVTTGSEQRRAAETLGLSGASRLLDIACGPGNFTSKLVEQLPPDGLAVGLDISVPMLSRAVQDNSGPRTCYVRGDAGSLPFDDETFDAVCCFGALYLMPEPFKVAREMVRVLRPGGRVAILTSYATQLPGVRQATQASAKVIGLRLFDRDVFVDLFSDAGLTDIDQQIQRNLQFVSAGKPA
ncbi:methyltransferase domain-containing protein [Mycobacterium sp.]|uniref:class I SAM-dependent methyltransferase n=1 Tax=Mycobacterium sp. TaxID=1785 RepID=UPI0025E46C4A|nr:methyltransferase domain-containing protein [Mycobacterium sp.]